MRRAASLAFVLASVSCATAPATRQDYAPSSRGGESFSESDLPETEAAPPRGARSGGDLDRFDLQARIAVRARSYLGRRGPFRAKGQRFSGDCSGFVEAVYAAEGIMLRDLMQRAAPEESGGVRAAWYAARENGRTLGPREWPAPGDLVFWNDTYDRNRNGRTDDRFTHLGIVEYVDDGTVYFLHRGGKGVARGVMTPARPGEARAADGRRLNSPLRAATHPVRSGGLAGQLLVGYGRIDPARVPARYVTREIDPFFGPGADPEDRDVAGAAATGPAEAGAPAVPPELRKVEGRSAPSPAWSRAAPLPAATFARTTRSAPDPAPRRAAAAKPSNPPGARRINPLKKDLPPHKLAKKKALARAKPAAAKGRPAVKKVPQPAARRAEIAAAGGSSVPSSPTRTAAAPKSSAESRRSTGITDPAGSR